MVVSMMIGAMAATLGDFSLTSWLFLGLAGIIGVWYKLHIRRYPAGPFSLPIIGTPSMFAAFSTYQLYLAEIYRKYGPVYTIFMGSRPMVILSDIKTIREALVTKGIEFANRPYPTPTTLLRNPKCLGIIDSPYTEEFRARRKFSLITLRNFGFGRRSLEARIQEESGFLVKEIEELGGQPFDDYLILRNAVSNIICSMVFGQRFDYQDMEFRRMLHLTDLIFEDMDKGEELDYIPLGQYLPAHKRIMKDHAHHIAEMRSFFMKNIEDHQASRDPEDPRDFIDVYLNEIESSGKSDFTLENLWLLVFDFFLAGTETTSTTLRWALLYMANNPEIQGKIQAEIDKVIGKDQPLTLNHKSDMPFTEATIHEVLRLSPIAPVTLPHSTSTDTSIDGHPIPKDTEIWINIWAVHHDPKIWAEPDLFKPEHFLDEDGHFRKREEWIPFSLGRRICLGEQLAKMEVFLFFTALLQRFQISPPNGTSKLPEDGEHHFAYVPKPHKICAECRQGRIQDFTRGGSV